MSRKIDWLFSIRQEESKVKTVFGEQVKPVANSVLDVRKDILVSMDFVEKSQS